MNLEKKTRLNLLARSGLWAILPDKLPALIDLLSHGKGDWLAAQPSAIGKTGHKASVIPVQGVLTKDGPSWLGSNYDAISTAVERAADDPAVKHIVLAVDSPGGEVTGLPETAAVIAAARKVKPVTAMVEGTAASAAYWLASQATDIVLTPSGEVGSVGVRMIHMDVSEMLEKQGIKPTELSAGEFKTEWSPFQPLTDAAKEDMQGRLDTVHKNFIRDIGNGRGSRAGGRIRAARFGEGRMFPAKDALAQGLVDSLRSSREFYRSLTTSAPESTRPTASYRARLELERLRARI